MIGILLPLLLLLAFLLSGMESALLHVSRVRARHAAEEGDTKAARLAPLLEHRVDLLHAATGLNHLVSLAAFLLCTFELASRLGGWGWGVALLGVLPAFLVGVKLVPMLLFRRYPFRTLRRLAAPLLLLHAISGPWRGLARFIHATLPADHHPHEDNRGLRALADTVGRLGVLPAPVCALVQRFAAFQERRAADIMLPLGQLLALPPDLPLASAQAINGAALHPWRAVLGPDGVLVGWLDMTALPKKAASDKLVRQFMRPLLRLSPADPALRCLQALRKRREPVAAVVDAAGETIGVVTQQALLRELLAA